MVWDDGAVKNGWLQVTVRAERLGLAEDDVFYFGNAVGETGNSAADARVSVADLLLARNNPRGLLDPAEIDCPYDFNRDRRVNATDVLLGSILGARRRRNRSPRPSPWYGWRSSSTSGSRRRRGRRSIGSFASWPSCGLGARGGRPWRKGDRHRAGNSFPRLSRHLRLGASPLSPLTARRSDPADTGDLLAHGIGELTGLF